MNTPRQVVITGLGVISPVGQDVDDFFANLCAGRSGIDYLPAEQKKVVNVDVAGQVDYQTSKKTPFKTIGLDRCSIFALVAANQAIQDARLNIPIADNLKERIGVYWGTGMGGAETTDRTYRQLYLEHVSRLSPLTVPTAMNNAAMAQIGLQFGCQGPSANFCVACASSAIAIGEAYRVIRHGYADVMITGGSEALLTYGPLKAWEALRLLASAPTGEASAACRPFSKNRGGLVLGEGAAALILEEKNHAMVRGAPIYAELIGYSVSTDSHHLVQPSVEGEARAMRLALDSARISHAEIDYINAHATATPIGDLVETQAIKQVFGEYAYQVPISSTKSMMGHLLGAAGALELMVAVLTICHQRIPPTMHLDMPDPECDLDYVANQARVGPGVITALSNSFAFGGSNAVLIARANSN